MKTTAFKLFSAFYILFFGSLLYVVISTTQAGLHVALTLDYLSECSADFVAFQDVFFKYITELGSWIPFVVAAGLLFYRAGASLFVLVSQLALGIVTHIIKVTVAAPRPKLFFGNNFPNVALHRVEGVVVHSTNSFPSGHTAAVFSLMLCLTLIFNKKPQLTPIFFILAVLAAYSRIYLSQHFAEDVLAGSLVGVLITLLVYYFYQRKPYAWGKKSVLELLKI